MEVDFDRSPTQEKPVPSALGFVPPAWANPAGIRATTGLAQVRFPTCSFRSVPMVLPWIDFVMIPRAIVGDR
jgi:hypothetical protein